MIRVAARSDIMAMVGVLEDAYSKSIYPQYGAFDREETRRFLDRLLQAMGDRGKNSTLMWVACNEAGKVGGLVVGIKGPVYFVGTKLGVHEVYLYGIKGAIHARDMIALAVRFDTWANADDRVVEVKCSSSDIFPWQAWPELRPFYLSRGYKVAGEVFVRRIQR